MDSVDIADLVVAIAPHDGMDDFACFRQCSVHHGIAGGVKGRYALAIIGLVALLVGFCHACFLACLFVCQSLPQTGDEFTACLA